MKKFLLSIFVVLSILFVMPIAVPALQNTYTVQAASIKINKKKLTLNVKEKYTLKVKGTKKKVKWTTSNKKIAKVTSKGKVTANKKGNVIITAKVGSKKYKCKIKVENPKLNKSSITLAADYTFQLKVKGTSQKIKWSSENKNIAKVNSKGLVTGVAQGTTKIVAKVGNTKYKCTIVVPEPDYTNKIKITYTKIEDSLVATIQNNNNRQIDYVRADVYFYNNNTLQGTSSLLAVCLGKGGIAHEQVYIPNDDNGNDVIFNRVEFVVTNANIYKYSPYVSLKKNVVLQHNNGTGYDGVIGTVTNTGDTEIGAIEIFVEYYKNGKVVGCGQDYITSLKPGKKEAISVLKDWSIKNSSYVDYDSYKIYLDRATK